MVKKRQKTAAKKKAATPSSLFDSQLAGAVKDSAQQIWLAGMGAFAKAQAEGGKMFDALVKEGSSLQRKTQPAAGERLGEVTGRMSAMASDVGSKAGASWDRLESIFEDRTAKALARLGVPTAREVEALAQRVEELAAAVVRLGASGAAASVTAKSAQAIPPGGKRSAKAAAKKAAPARKPANRKPADLEPADLEPAVRKTAVRKTAARKTGAASEAAVATTAPRDDASAAKGPASAATKRRVRKPAPAG